jgi:hypothetical protein
MPLEALGRRLRRGRARARLTLLRRVRWLGLVAAVLLVPVLPAAAAPEASADSLFRELEPGLELAEHAMPTPGVNGDSRLVVLRIDLERFDLKLLNASAPNQGEARSAREWCAGNGLVAAINASMYQIDQRTSVSLMQSADHVNNARLSRDRAILAFDRADTTVPRADIIDLTCQDFAALRPRYRSFVQSIRMVSCTGENTWKPQERRSSIAAIAIDTAGRILFLHCRTAYSTHDLIAGLLALPLQIARAMYAEGGGESQLFVQTGDFELERMGRIEGGTLIEIQDATAWPIPNVIGIVRRPVP